MTASGGSHTSNAAGNNIPSIGKAKPGGGQMDSAGRTELKSGKSGKVRPCRFYASGKGCRSGEDCPFLHDQSLLPINPLPENELPPAPLDPSGPSSSTDPSTSSIPKDRRQAVSGPVPAARVVSKPVPKSQTENPREFQLTQIRRRFNPKETISPATTEDDGATILDLRLKPSDPDFPFELDALHCVLTVPAGYPDIRASLKVKNKDMPRGFAINIEKGFDGFIEERKDATLLLLISLLDKHLEDFLSEKKADTVKLVANVDRRHITSAPVRITEPITTPVQEKISPAVTFPMKYEEVFTAAQKLQAQQRRATETRQLESRLGRLPLYKKSHDGIAYTLPIEPRKRSELPVTVRAVKTVKLFVPLLYPLQPCRIHLEAVPPEDAKGIELAFEQQSKTKKELSLMNHINLLSQNMHDIPSIIPDTLPAPPTISVPEEPQAAAPITAKGSLFANAELDDDRSHIKFIPRPPEWDTPQDNESGDSESYSDDSEESEDGGIRLHTDDEDEEDAPTMNIPETPHEHGIAISFSSLVMENISLLTVSTLTLGLKCLRCKSTETSISIAVPTIAQIEAASSTSEPLKIPAATTACLKCSTPLTVTYRPSPLFPSAEGTSALPSSRAGNVDPIACTPHTFLPSKFTTSCLSCLSETPNLIATPGDVTRNICHKCHQKFSFSFSSTKFQRVGAAAEGNGKLPERLKRRKNELGVSIGSPLPDLGRCKHYKRSLRWFRFSCCQKVYACDICHDEASTAAALATMTLDPTAAPVLPHINERSEKMICGYCSREQVYRPNDCAVCGSVLVANPTGMGMSGFWEGGRGTRDKVKMSKKDGRKYRRGKTSGGAA